MTRLEDSADAARARPQLSRRRLMGLCAAAGASVPAVAGLVGCTPANRALGNRPPLPLMSLPGADAGLRVPPDFLGLSYEVKQLEDPTFFSPDNRELVSRFRELAPRGVLRLGGNTSDLGWWKPSPSAPRPPMTVRTEGGPAPGLAQVFAIEPAAIATLRGFLDATDWTCVFGINLANNTPERAASQARHVAEVLGPRLNCFQLGNEPDLYARHLRDPATWGPEAYFEQWRPLAVAVQAAVPSARFGLPDTAGNPAWAGLMVQRLLTPPAMAPRLRIAALSHHYYFGGPPSNPDVNLGRLLQPDPAVRVTAAAMHEAAARLKVPLRMTEGNTCYLGGKPGVSDVHGAALWSADYLLTLASLGYAGVNLHGGGGSEVASSLGGSLPGELLMPDPRVPHPRPFYTPIASLQNGYVIQPVGVGMQFAGAFAGTRMMALHFDPGPVNATAYAAQADGGSWLLAVINKDAARELHLQLPGWEPAALMQASSLAATTVQLSRLPAEGGVGSVSQAGSKPGHRVVAPASALLLRHTG